MFKRRASDAPDVLDQGSADEPELADPVRPGVSAAKGRPTPKRSESEKNRRGPYSAPTDRKSAAPRNKERDRATRNTRLAAMRRGEDWALPRKDQGPVKGLARDVVDSRRGISEYYLYGIVVLIAALFIPGLRQNYVVDVILIILAIIIIIEGWYVSNKVLRLANERYPGQSTRGVRVYTALRGTQIRKIRVPAPRVTPKTKI